MTNASTSTFYKEIIGRLDEVRRRQSRIAIVYGVLATILVAVVAILVTTLLEGIFSFSTPGRTVLFIIEILAISAASIWFIIRPALHVMGFFSSENNYTIAVKVGSYFPHIRDRLLDALQIYESRENLAQLYSPALIDASFTDLYRYIQPLRFAEAVSDDRVKKIRKVVSYSLALFLLLFIIPQLGLVGSFYRIVNFNTSFAASLPVQLSIEPGNIDAVRGQTVPVTIHAQGKPLEHLSFYMRQQGQVDFDALTLNAKSAGVFQTDIVNIKATTEYFVSAEDVRSDKYTINVLDRPLLRSFQISIESPAYTRIPERILEVNQGDVAAYPGSRMKLRLQSSKALGSSMIVFGDKTTMSLTVSGVEANVIVPLRKELTYHLLLKDQNGLSNTDPVEYTIKLLRDEHPTAELIVPGKNIDVTEQMSVDLHMRTKDDFGFSKLRLAYRLAQSRYEEPQEQFTFLEIPLTTLFKRQENLDIWHHWDLSALHLVPEDAIAYYIEVFDNDNVNGPKSGRSDMYLIRLPSLEEIFTDVSQSQQQSVESMENAAKESQQLKKDVEALHRELQKNRNKPDWQQQKKAEELLKRYEAMKKNLEQVTQQMDEAVKKMDENKLLSSKTMEKYQELQKLMEQLMSPELQKALKKLQESMKQPSPEEMQRAMEQLKASEDQFRKSLERTIELLKRIAIEQKLDELIKRAEELKKQQDELQQQTSKSSDQQKREELAKKQDDLQKQMGSLEKETSELRNKMEEFPKEMPVQEMTKAEQSMKQKQTGKKMNNAAQQMRSGNMQGAEKDQEDSEEDLSEMQEELSDVQKQLQDNQLKQIVNQMKKQLQNVIELSKNEESLKNTSKDIDPNSPSFRESAENQNEVMSDLEKVSNAMAELSKKTFAVSPEMSKELGNAQKGMQGAMQNMETRNPVGTSQKQSEAMGSLNRAASMMQSAINAMSQGGKGGSGMSGLLGRLGQMAGQQSDINSGTQQAMGKGGNQGQGLSAEQQGAYQRLAQQQSSVQKSLQELSEEAKNTGEFSKLLGDLDRVERDMQEIVGDLNQGEVNPQTLEKQDRILSRLLDASRSARERDYEKRRKAEAGKDYRNASPAEIDLTTQEGRNKLREEILKIREGKYSKDYEELIRKYYEELEKEKVDQ